VDHHADHVLGQAHRFCGFCVDHRFDDLNFQEVVSRPERSALAAASLDGAVADVVRFGSGQAAASFGEFNVVVRREASVFEERDAFAHQLAKFGFRESVFALSTGSRRNFAKQTVDQPLHVRLDVLVKQVRTKQPDAAVDVISNPSGRDDSAFLRVGRADSADGESVSPVNVRHGQARELDSGQSRDIGNLVGSLIVPHLLDQLVTCVDQTVDAHV
jgi:hypothetical protein